MTRPLRRWSALAAAFVSGGVLMSVVSAPAQDPPPTVAPLVRDVDDPALADRKFVEEERKLAEEALKVIAAQQRDAGFSPSDDAVVDWNHRLAETRLALARTPDERTAAVSAFVEHMKRALAVDEARKQIGEITPRELLDTEYGLMEAERWLARTRSK
jgi:hypothetical protein